jgi:hypothetical protein
MTVCKNVAHVLGHCANRTDLSSISDSTAAFHKYTTFLQLSTNPSEAALPRTPVPPPHGCKNIRYVKAQGPIECSLSHHDVTKTDPFILHTVLVHPRHTERSESSRTRGLSHEHVCGAIKSGAY